MAESFVGALLGGAGGAALGTLYVRLTAESIELVKGMAEAELTVKHGAATMAKELTGLATIATGALALIGVAAVEEFAKFEKAITRSTAIMGNVTAELRKEMEDTARTIAKESTISATDLARSYKTLAQAGMDAKSSMAALHVVSELAEAGELDAARAAQVLVEAQAGLGLKTKDAAQNLENMTRVSDVLVKASTMVTASVEELSSALAGKAGASLRSVNKDIEEGVAIIATFASQGLKGGEAGAALNMVIKELQKNAIENRQVFEDLGVSVFDAAGKMRNMADIIGDIEKSFAGASTEQRKMVLGMMGFQERSVISILSLVGMSDRIREYEKTLREAGGTTEEVAKKDLEDLHSQLEITANRLKDILNTIGEGLAPAIKNLNSMLQDFTTVNSAANASIKDSAGIIGTMLVGAIKGVIKIFEGWRDLMKLVSIGLINLAEIDLQVFQALAKALEALLNAIISGFNALFVGRINKLIDELNERLTKTLGIAGAFMAMEHFKGLEEVTIGVNPEKFDQAIDVLERFKRQMWDSLHDTSISAAKTVEDSNKKIEKSFEDMAKGVKISMEDVEKATEVGTAVVQANSKLARDALDKIGGPKTSLESMGFSREDILSLRGVGVSKETIEGLSVPKMPRIDTGMGDASTSQISGVQEEISAAQDRLKILREIGNDEVKITEEVQKRKEAAIKAYNERIHQLQLAQAQILVQAGQNMFDALAQAAEGFAGRQSAIYKAMFAASKAFAIAEAVVKIQQGIANAASLSWPANLAAIASVVAATANIVSTIAAVRLEIAGERAAGGPVAAGQSYLVGERGPEVFTPAAAGMITPNDRIGGSTRVVINNYTDAQAQVFEHMEGQERVVEVMIKRIKSDLSSEVRDGRGEVAKAMESSWGLRRGTR